MVVLDASAALAGILSARVLNELLEHDPVAPPLLWSEATSALSQSLWREEITDETASGALDRLLSAPFRRHEPKRLQRETWSIARELGWAKTYDAEYVALARLLDCRLLTRDARLKRWASGIVDVIGPMEL